MQNFIYFLQYVLIFESNIDNLLFFHQQYLLVAVLSAGLIHFFLYFFRLEGIHNKLEVFLYPENCKIREVDKIWGQKLIEKLEFYKTKCGYYLKDFALIKSNKYIRKIVTFIHQKLA